MNRWRITVNIYFTLFVVILIGILQSSFVPHLSIGQAHPDLLVVVVIAWAFLRDFEEGMVWAFCGGLTLDLLSNAPFGIFTLSLLLTVVVLHTWEDKTFGSTYFLPVLLALPYTFLFNVFVASLLKSLGYAVNWRSTLFNLIVPACLMNLVLMAIVFPAISRLHQVAQRENLSI